uniref:Uncharacterized protein n=1 Tax=Photinus pyralis TaxID=7054 RepID=A0A1Y1M3Z7_PHOPY
MKEDPVAGNVDCHGEKEPERVPRVKRNEDGAQAHRTATVGELIEHGAKFRALIEVSRGVSIEGVEKGGEDVASGRHYVIRGHKVKGDDREDYPPVTDNVWHKEEYIFRTHFCSFNFTFPLLWFRIDLI